MLILCLVALGGYFAATEGVMTALAGAVLPEELQASGIGILITVVSIGSLLSSLAFGALWFALGLQSAVLVFAAALVLAIVRSRRRCCCGRSGRRAAWIAAAARSSSRSSPSAWSAAAPTSRSPRSGPSQTTTDARPRGGAPCWPTATLMVRAVDPSEADASTAASSSSTTARCAAAAGRPRLRARLLRRRAAGICMGVAPSGVDYTATIFDSKLQPLHTRSRLTGLPSRARVSATAATGR